MQPSNLLVGIAWVMLTVVFQSASAVFGKMGGLTSAGQGLAGLFFNPWLAAIFAALGAQAVCWVLALRHLPLNFAYSFMGLVLPLNLLASHLLFGEKIGIANLIGMALIITGISMLLRRGRL